MLTKPNGNLFVHINLKKKMCFGAIRILCLRTFRKCCVHFVLVKDFVCFLKCYINKCEQFF